MIITYAITAHNEHMELAELLNQICENVPDKHQILVQTDKGNTTFEVLETIDRYRNVRSIDHVEFALNNDFAAFKNNLKENSKGEWIFQIDADELLGGSLLNSLNDLLSSEDVADVDVIRLSRINIVKGLTQDHVRQWGWVLQKDENYEQPIINYPDFQWRIYRNIPEIKWEHPVHEILTGWKKRADLQEKAWSLIHIKNIDKQEKQNELYDKIIKTDL
jgi:cellulose synthase/poly-beta-1,6-N-acetylglucosamine synthase-like glycosyltransferase